MLEEWQGMGYNRRALALLHAAQLIVDRGGTMLGIRMRLWRCRVLVLQRTGIRAFAWNLPACILKQCTVVFLHEFFSTELMCLIVVSFPCLRKTVQQMSHPPSWSARMVLRLLMWVPTEALSRIRRADRVPMSDRVALRVRTAEARRASSVAACTPS